jgi:hypothetical protein
MSELVGILLAYVKWLDSHSGFAVALATTVLVTVTAYYAWQTRQTVKVMRDQYIAANQQRKASIMPVIILVRDQEKAKLLNAGHGIALNVRAWCRNDSEELWSGREQAESLGAGTQAVPHWVESWYKHFLDPAEVWIRYDDAEGNRYHSHMDRSGRWERGEDNGRAPPEVNADDPLYKKH